MPCSGNSVRRRFNDAAAAPFFVYSVFRFLRGPLALTEILDDGMKFTTAGVNYIT